MTGIWVALALTSTLLFSIASFVDKYVLSKKFESLSPLGYMALTGITGLPFVIFLGGMASTILPTISASSYVMALLAGFSFTAGFGLYIKALSTSETSMTASLFQLTVLWNLLFGVLFLSEIPTVVGIAGIFLLFIGSLVLAQETDLDDNRKTRLDTFFLMIVACLLISTSDVLFKLSVDKGNYISTQFLEYASSVIVGLMLYAGKKRVRKELHQILNDKRLTIIAIVLLNELVNLGAVVASRLSIVHLDIAIAQAIMGVQPLILIGIGYLLTRLVPDKISEVISRKHFGIKIAGAITIFIAELLVISSIL